MTFYIGTDPTCDSMHIGHFSSFLISKRLKDEAVRITEALFSGNIKELNVSEIENAFQDVPNYDISENKNLVALLVEAKICSSKREAREFVF